jgi:hypothetical protein
MAFFVAYHHGGDLLVHKTGPAGPGFELLMPTDPTQIQRPDWQAHLSADAFEMTDNLVATPSA